MDLTIAIPTRNRCKLLKSTIESIINQGNIENIEILVLDNSDPDKKCFYVKDFPHVRYISNEEVLSLDLNMIKVAELASKKYVLWLGDDDMLSESFIKEIEPYISLDCDLYLINAYKVSEDFKTCYGSFLKDKSDKFFSDPVRFFIECWNKMPFGSLLFKKEIFERGLHKAHAFTGTYHAYAGVLLEGLSSKALSYGYVKLLVIGKPLIYFRVVEKSWSSEAAKMYKSKRRWFYVLSEFYSPYKFDILKEFLKSSFSMRLLLQLRSEGQISIENFSEYTEDLSLRYKIKYIVVSLIPIKLLRILIKFYKIFKKTLRSVKTKHTSIGRKTGE